MDGYEDSKINSVELPAATPGLTVLRETDLCCDPLLLKVHSDVHAWFCVSVSLSLLCFVPTVSRATV